VHHVLLTVLVSGLLVVWVLARWADKISLITLDHDSHSHLQVTNKYTGLVSTEVFAGANATLLVAIAIL
jgi:hypothetical protein